MSSYYNRLSKGKIFSLIFFIAIMKIVDLSKPLFFQNVQNIKAFYMRLNDDGKTVAAMDMLVPRVIPSSIFHYNQMMSFSSHEYASMAKWAG